MSATLDPKPGYVIKSRVLEAHNYLKYSSGTKIFINICHDSQVPKPKQEFDPAVVFPLIIQNEWEIPIIVSEEKETRDKKGIPSFVYDCCINSLCFQWCQVNAELRQILNEWCLESVEMLYEVTLDREYSIPKMLSKGELSSTVVQNLDITENGFEKKLQHLKENDTLGVIEELKPVDDQHDRELPDLLNIQREHRPGKKPLIQEVEDMRIQPQVEKAKTENVENVRFTVSFKKLTSDYQLLVKLTTSENIDLTGKLTLNVDQKQETLILQPTASSGLKISDTSNELRIPVRTSWSCDPHAFYVRKDKSIYIFV